MASVIGKSVFKLIKNQWKVTIVLLLFCVACSPKLDQDVAIVSPIPTEKRSTELPASHTPFLPTIEPTATATQVRTKIPTPTATTTPFDLETFSSKIILRTIKPQAYIDDQCQYLSNRWEAGKSEPGTIVVPVMYHSIRQPGKPVNDSLTVSHEYFEETMQHARQLGFETITTQQLVDFLYHNQKIPRLSMILIVDDRRLGVVRDHFMQVLEENNWTVTLAYITGVATQSEWDEMQRLNINGALDVQAHGFYHNGNTYFTEFTPAEVIHEEIFSPIDVIRQHTGKKPLAFIWPGGNFTSASVAVAREAQYQIGFTVFSRGPIMYNWIPLGDAEIKMNDPLMVLPRFWSTSAYANLDEAVEISNQARFFSQQNYKAENEWFQSFCADYQTPENIVQGD